MKMHSILGALVCISVSVGCVAGGEDAAAPEERTGTANAEIAAKSLRYRYVSLDAVPDGFLFWEPAVAIANGTVFGTGWACEDSCVPSVLAYSKGAHRTVAANTVFYAANASGVVGGSVVDEAFTEQAVIIRQSGVETLARLPGELTSRVLRLTNAGVALVESFDEAYNATYYVYKNNSRRILNFGGKRVAHLDVNDSGTVSGTFLAASASRAFRMDSASGATTVLNPLPSEPQSWGQAINSKGDVLGYSFQAGSIERIGVFDKMGQFETRFVEGTSEVPTISNSLLWNEPGTIVITRTSRQDMRSYIVPKSGVRLNLADLVDGVALPAWTLMSSINEKGAIVGSGGASYFSIDQNFLLEPL